MKILKIFGLVVGIHVFALILIFANPGCSSSTKPTPAPVEPVARTEPTPSIALPASPAPASDAAFTPAPIAFDPNAPAVAASGSGGGGVRFNPTRPHTPAATAVVAEPVTDVTPATTYVVMNGDSLWTIAKKSHLTVAELAAANNLKASAVLKPGQKLILPGKPASPTAAATANPGGGGSAKATSSTAVTPGAAKNGDVVKHMVKNGETLSQIAKQYGVSTRDLGVANHISDPQKLQAGTELVIPGGWMPAGKSGKAGTKSGPDTTKKASAPMLNIEDPAPAKSPDIPVIKPEESIFTPAPKK